MLKKNNNSNELKEILSQKNELTNINQLQSTTKKSIKTFSRSYSSNLESKEPERIKPTLATFVRLYTLYLKLLTKLGRNCKSKCRKY